MHVSVRVPDGCVFIYIHIILYVLLLRTHYILVRIRELRFGAACVENIW